MSQARRTQHFARRAKRVRSAKRGKEKYKAPSLVSRFALVSHFAQNAVFASLIVLQATVTCALLAKPGLKMARYCTSSFSTQTLKRERTRLTFSQVCYRTGLDYKEHINIWTKQTIFCDTKQENPSGLDYCQTPKTVKT